MKFFTKCLLLATVPSAVEVILLQGSVKDGLSRHLLDTRALLVSTSISYHLDHLIAEQMREDTGGDQVLAASQLRQEQILIATMIGSILAALIAVALFD